MKRLRELFAVASISALYKLNLGLNIVAIIVAITALLVVRLK